MLEAISRSAGSRAWCERTLRNELLESAQQAGRHILFFAVFPDICPLKVYSGMRNIGDLSEIFLDRR
jgi:hypothetical protein